MTKSVLQNPKNKWTALLRDRPLKDLVDIDFPYALGTGQMTPVRLVVVKILASNPGPNGPDIGPRLIAHIKNTLKTQDVTNKNWRGVAAILADFLPSRFSRYGVHSEKNIGDVFLTWMNDFPRSESAIQEALKDAHKKVAFLERMNVAVKTLAREDSTLALSWITFLGADVRRAIAKDMFTEMLDDSGLLMSPKDIKLSPSTETYFPELSQVILEETTATLKKHIILTGGDLSNLEDNAPLGGPVSGALMNLLQGLCQGPPPAPANTPVAQQQQASLTQTLLTIGKLQSAIETRVSLQKISTACCLIKNFYKENKGVIGETRYHGLFDLFEKHKELYSSLGELGQVAKSYSEKKNILENIPELTTKNPKQKNKM